MFGKMCALVVLVLAVLGCRASVRTSMPSEVVEVERLMLSAVPDERNLERIYRSIETIARGANLRRHPWGGINKRRRGDEVIVYVVDYQRVRDLAMCDSASGDEARCQILGFQGNCVAFGPSSIACDVRHLVVLEMYAFSRSFRLLVAAMLRGVLGRDESVEGRGQPDTPLRLVESVLDEEGGFETHRGFLSVYVDMSVGELVQLGECAVSYAACLDELERVATVEMMFGMAGQLDEVLREGLGGYIGFLLLHELGHVEHGDLDGDIGSGGRHSIREREEIADGFAMRVLRESGSPLSMYMAPFWFLDMSRTFLQGILGETGNALGSMSSWEEIGGREMSRIGEMYREWACGGLYPRLIERYLRYARESRYEYPDLFAVIEVDGVCTTGVDVPTFRRYGAWLLSL
ncbi:MAG: hypothetical protein H6711_14220 [Myxococcales bacterium]|nr:hypothetical protein [Myxococcales bacterium]